MTGLSPVVLIGISLFEYIKKCLVFLAAIRTYVQMFSYKRHQAGSILSMDFIFDIFVQPRKDLAARRILLTNFFQDAQKT